MGIIASSTLIVFLNTGSYSTPVWSPLGKRVTDSSEQYDWSAENTQDILGNNYSDLKKPVVSQSFDPWNITGGDAAAVKLWNLAVKDQDAAALSSQDLLIVHRYAGTAGSAMFAERYPASAVSPTGLGGEGGGRISMPVDITFGGVREVGTAAITSAGVATFTAA